MAVTYVERLSQSKTIGFPSADPAVFDAFTPAAGERLLAIVGAQEVLAHTQDFTGSLTISDTQGLTWTPIDAVANIAADAIGMRAWISSPATATSTTVTIDGSFYFFFSNELKVLGLSGASGAIVGYVENAAAATNGADALTLAAAPTTDDLTVFARYLDSDVGSGLDMGTGWTELAAVTGLLGESFGVAIRTSSVSTTVTVTDTAVDAATVDKAISFAFTVQATVPAAFTRIAVTRDYDLATGSAPAGTVSFTPSDWLVNGGVTVPAAPVIAALDADGKIAVTLVANTDPDTVPADSYYTVQEDIAGQPRRQYRLRIPHTLGSSVDLAGFAATYPDNPLTGYGLGGYGTSGYGV